MISYSVYKIFHMVGIFMVMLSLGGLATHLINGGGKQHSWRKAVGITHGVGLFLALVGGFGMLARLGIAHGGLPGWAIIKLGIWLIFAVLIAILLRKPNWARPLWLGMIVLGGLAAYVAGYKPL